MAQQVGALRIKDKVGNVVGFGNSASDKSNKNFVRQAAANVANPKTYRQATQRSKVKPAAAFYSAFENVLNHAFLPSLRASKNRNRFMKLAMLLSAIPDVRKDDNYLPVVPYQISEGNLGLDNLTVPGTATQVYNVDFNMPGTGEDMTVGSWAQSVLTMYPQLEIGQELTFIAILANTDRYVRRAVHFSVVLDPNNTITTMDEVMNASGIRIDGSGELCPNNVSETAILAAGLIISSKTSASWRYTKSFMYLSGAGAALPDIEAEVIASYMSAASSAESEKILQQANNSSVAVVKIISTTTTALSNATGITGTLAPTNATVAVFNNGKRAVVTMLEDGEPVLAYKNGDSWAAIKRTGTGEPAVTASVTLETTNLAGNPTVDVSFVIAAGL